MKITIEIDPKEIVVLLNELKERPSIEEIAEKLLKMMTETQKLYGIQVEI